MSSSSSRPSPAIEVPPAKHAKHTHTATPGSHLSVVSPSSVSTATAAAAISYAASPSAVSATPPCSSSSSSASSSSSPPPTKQVGRAVLNYAGHFTATSEMTVPPVENADDAAVLAAAAAADDDSVCGFDLRVVYRLLECVWAHVSDRAATTHVIDWHAVCTALHTPLPAADYATTVMTPSTLEQLTPAACQALWRHVAYAGAAGSSGAAGGAGTADGADIANNDPAAGGDGAGAHVGVTELDTTTLHDDDSDIDDDTDARQPLRKRVDHILQLSKVKVDGVGRVLPAHRHWSLKDDTLLLKTIVSLPMPTDYALAKNKLNMATSSATPSRTAKQCQTRVRLIHEAVRRGTYVNATVVSLLREYMVPYTAYQEAQQQKAAEAAEAAAAAGPQGTAAAAGQPPLMAAGALLPPLSPEKKDPTRVSGAPSGASADKAVSS